MKNTEIAGVFREIADILEARHDNIFKIRAYRKAAASIETMTEPLCQLVREGRLDEVPGVGPAIAKKISELMTTGKLGYYERLKAGTSGEATGTRTDSKGKKPK